MNLNNPHHYNNGDSPLRHFLIKRSFTINMSSITFLKLRPPVNIKDNCLKKSWADCSISTTFFHVLRKHMYKPLEKLKNAKIIKMMTDQI